MSIMSRVALSALLGVIACQTPSPETPATIPAARPLASKGTVMSSPEAAPPEVPLAEASAVPAQAPWWDQPYPTPFDGKRLSNAMPSVRVEGNHFVDSTSRTVIFQGVSIADPDKLSREGQWSPKLFEVIRTWGANVVRIPVHPAAWRGLGSEAYLRLLDQALTWANQEQLYLIIDWHSIGNLKTGLFQHPMYDTTLQETLAFWRTIAHRYAGVSTIAMYELFNEPTIYNGNLGNLTWAEWKEINEEMISIIYSFDKDVIPLVAGFNWAYQLEPVADAPVDRDGVAYVSHPYPQKTEAPFGENWDKHFGFVAETYPLIATEIGYMLPDEKGAHIPVKNDGSYGPMITEYLGKKGASWVAWCFHPDWAPPLIADWSFTPTLSGEHFRKVMLKRRAAE